jgi:hypothetical protein
MYSRTNGSHYNFLAGSDIGRAAHNIQRRTITGIYGRYLQFVSIGVGYAGQHFADHQALKTTFYCFRFFNSLYFKAYRGKDIAELPNRQRYRKNFGKDSLTAIR